MAEVFATISTSASGSSVSIRLLASTVSNTVGRGSSANVSFTDGVFALYYVEWVSQSAYPSTISGLIVPGQTRALKGVFYSNNAINMVGEIGNLNMTTTKLTMNQSGSYGWSYSISAYVFG